MVTKIMIETTKTTHKKELMIEALRKSLGIVTTACLNVGIERSTHYDWLKNDSDYKAKVEALDDVVLDFAESQLHKRINEGSDTATIFFLKTKGKKRGYIEKQEITQTNLNVEVEQVTEEMQNELLNTLKRMIE
jgi:poly-gamma-glutamate capsule biosynthesis protein CapA/YwtB (metallophosphatase superfamily)